MTWVRLDDQWSDHPKFLDVGDHGRIVWVNGLCFASRFLTDGFIPARAAQNFIRCKRLLPAAIRELLAAGLWVTVDRGYQIHDYKEYQQLATQVKAERAANAERVKRWRERASNAVTSPITNGVDNALRAGTRASDVLYMGVSERGMQGGPASTATPARLPGAREIEAEILRHPVFASLSASVLAEQHAGFLMTAPQKLDWVIRAIDDCAAAHSALGLTAPELQRKIVSYMRHAKRPRAAEPAAATATKPIKLDDDSRGDEVKKANEERDARNAQRLALEMAAKGKV